MNHRPLANHGWLHKIALATGLLLGTLSSVAHGQASVAHGQERRLQIVASFSILGDMVRNVARDKADVSVIVGPNADAHTYRPTVTDARTVAGADIVFVNGLGFETWSQTLIARSGTAVPVIVATAGITPLMVAGEPDPHAWNAIDNGIIYTENIAKALVAADPANAAAYRAHAGEYVRALRTTARKVGAVFKQLPKDRRTVVTAHDAFGYLQATYGLRFLAPLGVSDEAEPSAKKLAELIAQLRAEQVAALFVENIKSPALVEQIARETGLKVGGRLYSDALSRTGPAQTYLGMLQHNARAIAAALAGKHPSRIGNEVK